MSQVDQAMQTIIYWTRSALGILLGVFATLDGFLRGVLLRAGVPPALQTGIILLIAALFIVAVLRVFGGVFRLLLVVFLILLMLHILVPNAGI